MNILKPIMSYYHNPDKVSDLNDITNLDEVKNKLIDVQNSKAIEFDDIDFSNCVFNECDLEQSTFEDASFLDCIFNKCNFSNVSFNKSSFIRCEFNNCKLIGTSLIDSRIYNVIINLSNANYLNLASNSMENVKFNDTSLKSSYFQDDELKNVYFEKAVLNQAQFLKTSLKNIDLSKSTIEGLGISIDDLKGAVINRLQALDLAYLLGVKISND